MLVIDSHCHLNDDSLFLKRKELIEEAYKDDVKIIICPSDSYKSSLRALLIAGEFENVYYAVGIHPSEVKNTTEEEYNDVKKIKSKKLVAIGEIGLDFYWEKDEKQRELQIEAFKDQIRHANELKLPIIVHSRDAINETLKVLREVKPLYGGVMHCYSGPKEMVKDFIDLGLYISFGGPLTFTNAKTPKEACLVTPLDRLLVETDSPYLSPHPFRGKENSPKQVRLVLKTLANIRDISEEEAARITSENAARLFHVKTNL